MSLNNSNQSIKILIIGPSRSGKTSITNFLTERNDTVNSFYRPTVGVRILEHEKEGPKHLKRPQAGKVNLEFWDISGDQKYENCYPAIQKGTQGIIFVYNAENPKHQQELENWVNAFPKKMGLPPAMCMAFAHHVSGQPIKGKTQARNFIYLENINIMLAPGLTNLAIYDTSIEEGSLTIIPAFDKFFQALMLNIYDRQDKEENNLLNEDQI